MSNKKTGTVKAGFSVIAVIIFFIVIIAVFLFINNANDSYVLKPDYGMLFDSMDVEIEWNDDRSCKITQKIDVTFLASSHGIYIDIPVNSGEKVRDIEIQTSPDRPYSLERESGNKIIRAVVGDPDIVFSSGAQMSCIITYDYITPEHPSGADILAFNAIGAGWTCYTKQAHVKMTYPAAPLTATDEYGIWIGTKKFTDSMEGVSVDWSQDGKTVDIDIGGRVPYKLYEKETQYYALAPFEKVELAYEMPSGTLKNYKDTEFLITLCVGLVLLAASIVLKFVVKNKTLTPIVDFYPPRIDGLGGKKRHMLPVQMGKIIDGSCSAADVTSLVFYWASKGYLEIEERDDETYFKKLKSIDAVTSYERKMFNDLFAKGKKNEDGTVTVSMSELKGKFSNAIKQTQSAVNAEYKISKLYKKSGKIICGIMYLLSAVFGFCVTALTSYRVGPLMCISAGAAAIFLVLVSVCEGMTLVMYYNKLKDSKRKFYTVIHFLVAVAFGIAVAAIVPNDVMTWLERIIFAVLFGIPIAIAPFFMLRTPMYDELLNCILGFRNFIRDAEKDKLEMLMADDPQYYYDILPYANVLGVSDIWEDKFKDITVEPPTYYRGQSHTVFDIIILNRLMHSVGQSLTYVPPSANKGSFSGGGHSGGGFSGGSFGGGGGGRW